MSVWKRKLNHQQNFRMSCHHLMNVGQVAEYGAAFQTSTGSQENQDQLKVKKMGMEVMKGKQQMMRNQGKLVEPVELGTSIEVEFVQTGAQGMTIHRGQVVVKLKVIEMMNMMMELEVRGQVVVQLVAGEGTEEVEVVVERDVNQTVSLKMMTKEEMVMEMKDRMMEDDVEIRDRTVREEKMKVENDAVEAGAVSSSRAIVLSMAHVKDQCMLERYQGSCVSVTLKLR